MVAAEGVQPLHGGGAIAPAPFRTDRINYTLTIFSTRHLRCPFGRRCGIFARLGPGDFIKCMAPEVPVRQAGGPCGGGGGPARLQHFFRDDTHHLLGSGIPRGTQSHDEICGHGGISDRQTMNVGLLELFARWWFVSLGIQGFIPGFGPGWIGGDPARQCRAHVPLGSVDTMKHSLQSSDFAPGEMEIPEGWIIRVEAGDLFANLQRVLRRESGEQLCKNFAAREWIRCLAELFSKGGDALGCQRRGSGGFAF